MVDKSVIHAAVVSIGSLGCLLIMVSAFVPWISSPNPLLPDAGEDFWFLYQTESCLKVPMVSFGIQANTEDCTEVPMMSMYESISQLVSAASGGPDAVVTPLRRMGTLAQCSMAALALTLGALVLASVAVAIMVRMRKHLMQRAETVVPAVDESLQNARRFILVLTLFTVALLIVSLFAMFISAELLRTSGPLLPDITFHAGLPCNCLGMVMITVSGFGFLCAFPLLHTDDGPFGGDGLGHGHDFDDWNSGATNTRTANGARDRGNGKPRPGPEVQLTPQALARLGPTATAALARRQAESSMMLPVANPAPQAATPDALQLQLQMQQMQQMLQLQLQLQQQLQQQQYSLQGTQPVQIAASTGSEHISHHQLPQQQVVMGRFLPPPPLPPPGMTNS